MQPKLQTVGDASFDDVTAGASAAVREIAEAARALIADVMPGVTEVAWPRQRNAGYGVGPKKMSEHFCYLGLNKAHVNLGFFYGADLADPQGLLEGTGKALRHVKLRSLEDVAAPALRDLIQRASKHLPKL